MSKIGPDNPLGILAFDHLEFTCDDFKTTESRPLFHKFGFAITEQSTTEPSVLFSQGQVRFLLTSPQTGHAREYYQAHGEGVSKLSFLVEDAEQAFNEAKKRGAEVVQEVQVTESEHGVFKTAQIKGFGDVLNEFVQRPRTQFRPGFQALEQDPEHTPLKQRVARIDHITNNVPKGEMKKWVKFYEDIYGFQVTRYFDIKGSKTGLQSEVVQLPDGAIIIPINEPDQDNGKSQIQEFLDRHKGSGVQHIALMTANITETVASLQEQGIRFLDIPHTYYEAIPKRGLNVTEDLGLLEERQLLVDGDAEGYLLQNFTDTYIGPLFFEIIQRKNHNGFGEGNFQALFDAIELDQMQRGYLD